MKSSLTNKTILAHSSNYTKGRKGQKICKITPHHMSGILTGEQCARIFQNSKRNASANYCIGYKGDIVSCVAEENRAWTSSSSWNDCRAITIEVSNNKIGGNWTVSDASWKSLVKLCADICKRYNFKLTYDGTKNGSLTRHNMFANTDCPGKYLQSKFPQLVKEVNDLLNKKESTIGKTKELKQDCVLYSNKDLTGTKYSYLKNTKVRIIKNITARIDYVQVIATGRKAYINTKYYK